MAREMKHSGIEWIGEIPKEWSVARIKTIYKERTDLSESGKETLLSVSEYYGIDSRASRIDDGEYLSRSESLLGYKKCFVGDFVSNIMLAWKGSFGVTKIDGIVSPAYCVYQPSDSICSFYYHYLFRTSLYTTRFKLFSKGIIDSRLRLYSPYFYDIEAIIPPLSEQQKIADYLDKVCGEVDEMIALQEQMIEELKAYKQSVITEAVTKGLNPNVPMKDSGIDWIGEVPEHWKIMPIKYIKSKEPNAFVDGPFGSNLKSEHFIENGDVLVVESGFITTGKFIFKEFKTISKEHFETIKRSQCKAKDIIIAKIGANYGMAGELPDLGKPSVVSGNSLKITLDNSKMLNTIFVNAMICAKSNSGFKGMVQENAQPALSLSGLNNFKLPVPPLSEQQSMASYLNTKCAEIDALIAIKQTKIEELKDYKKSVIYEYVTGKKEVE